MRRDLELLLCEGKELPEAMRGMFGVGDVWTWTALDSDTKLMIGYHVGRRDEKAARVFMEDLCQPLASRVQLTTDGHKVYLVAVPEAFAREIDYGMLKKIYSNPGRGDAANRYSPGECCGIQRRKIIGSPLSVRSLRPTLSART